MGSGFRGAKCRDGLYGAVYFQRHPFPHRRYGASAPGLCTGKKEKKYAADDLRARNYNIDLCGYPHEEEEILPPKELIQQYQEKRASLNADIDRILARITDILGIDLTEDDG